MIEAGRSCVHPGHRSGAVINLMWSALARYVLLSGHRYLAGCASVLLEDGESAAHTWALCAARHAPPSGMEVYPHHPWRPSEPGTGGGGGPGPFHAAPAAAARQTGPRVAAELPPTTRSSASPTSSWCSTWSS